MFEHDWLPKLEIERLDYPDGRKYQTPEGNQYESVTSWLSRTEDKSWLLEWKARVGEAEASRISQMATKRGTALHENVESYLMNQEVNTSTMSILDKSLFVPFASHLMKHITKVKALEYPLYSDILRLAGTVDLCAEYNGAISTIDFKTSKAMKRKEDISNYFLQASIYAIMLSERYKIRANKLIIIIAVDYANKVQVFEDDAKIWLPILLKRLKEFPPKRG